MNSRRLLATSGRVIGQLRRDRRSVGLVLVVPPALLALLNYVYERQPETMQRVGPALVGMLPLIMMFIITSVAMLRERSSGTLERLMTTPLTKLELLGGYGLGFALVAAVQATVTATVAFWVLRIDTTGAPLAVVALAVANAVLGVALGLFLSAFATSEFQAVQFTPAVIFPQLLLIGLFVERSELPTPLRVVSDLLPLTYAQDALARVSRGATDAHVWVDVAIVIGCIGVALVLGATTLKRRST